MLWENPNFGEMDTINYSVRIQKKVSPSLDYQYIGSREDFTSVFTGEELRRINHKTKEVEYVTMDSDPVSFDYIVKNPTFLAFSPIGLMNKDGWQYLQDTAIAGKTYSQYRWVEMDTLIDKTQVFLENHLFINPSNAIPDFYHRRNYHNGKRSQFIEISYLNYQFSDDLSDLSYEIPSSYLSKVQGTDPMLEVLEVGEMAPDFELPTMDGKRIKLSDFRGKRVLLDFSMINCGWCRIALKKFDDDDFRFEEDLVPLYVNPVDSEELMAKYLAKNPITFPVLVNAKETGKQYGVSGYPTFFIVDEQGFIEQVEVGYSDQFMVKLNSISSSED